MESVKEPVQHLDTFHDNVEDQKVAAAPLMKSSMDKLSIWQALLAYKRITSICMLAAFTASLDGYQINLNGSIVANKGFIAQMAPGTGVIAGQYVSAWGGIQSTGQFLGQVLLQYATDGLGRKKAMYIFWLVLALSVAIESAAMNWYTWLIAKLFAGIGVGMVQATLPVYIAEHAPNQIRGFLINAYTFWFVVGQLIAPVVLNVMNTNQPLNFRDPIYTQWGMIGLSVPILLWLPESPWWLVSKGRPESAAKILEENNGHIPGYNVVIEVEIMQNTIDAERRVSREAKIGGPWAVLQGMNGKRLFIAMWPKLMQQFVGLSVFNSYSTYFFQLAGNKNPFQVTVILACVQLISVIMTAALSDKFGRRQIVLVGYSITVASVLALGIIGFFDYASPALGSLLIFFACTAIWSTTGASALGYAFLAEVPQQEMRAITAGWGLAFTNLFAIMFSFVVPIWLKGAPNLGVKTGLIFAGTGIPVCIVGYFIVPETARRTPAEIDEMFENRVSLRHFGSYVTEVQAIAAEKERLDGNNVARS